eukprot:gnl/MRDRNA2_/MRDRNA2_300630_c0_seq1.p1 gnl/MRDRNA2_/MRDRNA2_300630_c0~~gnl/MRDRNA2_/MRDRNA2_300630_c0_seq1.p1  ORF type:complete len:347 (-),score=48.72 gnl/MRDRNA2_/MRDRNA2_300630_c0_seq1:216-1256(-)
MSYGGLLSSISSTNTDRSPYPRKVQHALSMNLFNGLANKGNLAGINVVKEKFMARRYGMLGNTFINIQDDESDSDNADSPKWDLSSRVSQPKIVTGRHSFGHVCTKHQHVTLTIVEQNNASAGRSKVSDANDTASTTTSSMESPDWQEQQWYASQQHELHTANEQQPEQNRGMQDFSGHYNDYTYEDHMTPYDQDVPVQHIELYGNSNHHMTRLASSMQNNTKLNIDTRQTSLYNTNVHAGRIATHMMHENLNPSPSVITGKIPPDSVKVEGLTKTELCKHYRRGYCARGVNCAYAHGQEQLKPKPNLSKTKMCRFSRRGCQNPYCTYAHAEEELRDNCQEDRFRL